MRSPEAVKGILTTKTDIWSLGIIIHLMCTARQRSKGEDYVPKNNYVDEYDPSVHHLDEVYSPALSDLTISMLQKDYQQRPTAAQILEILDKYGPEEELDVASFLKNFYEVGVENLFQNSLKYEQSDISD